MKKRIDKLRLPAILLASIILMRFSQLTVPFQPEQLGKGTIYLKENTIIKNIVLKEIKSFWIVYEKQQSLHDKMMEAIDRIEFPDAKPFPLKMVFEKNEAVLKHLEANR